MKKAFLFLICFVFLSVASHNIIAQQLENAEIGLRFNSNDNPFSVAIDGVYNLSDGNRFHANLGIEDGIGFDLLHDWVAKFNNERLIFYPGIGASLYFLDDFFLGVTGEVGLEYRFDIPLSLGIDYRPTLFLLEDFALRSNGVGFNVRFRF